MITIPESRRERENGFLDAGVYIFRICGVMARTLQLWSAIDPLAHRRSSTWRFDENFLKDRFETVGHGECAMLLKRAFWNCSELQLRLLDGGMSGAPVFKAYASLEAGSFSRSATGVAYPHLYFVKIGPRKKIVDEYDKYIWRHI